VTMEQYTITHVNVLTRDLKQSFTFYTEVLGFRYVMNLGPRKIVLDAGGFDFFIEEAEEIHLNGRFHLGMLMDLKTLKGLAAKLETHGIPLVTGNNPGAIVYTTPDGNRTAMYLR
jgi:catechol 2,3-dioxygenase-like lactoylglutathione lyase family enzyme